MLKRVLIGAASIITILIVFTLYFLITSEKPLDRCAVVYAGENRSYGLTCSADEDCGESGFYGEAYCKAGSVYQGYYDTRCKGVAGTCESKCVSTQQERLIKECENGCLSGQCR